MIIILECSTWSPPFGKIIKYAKIYVRSDSVKYLVPLHVKNNESTLVYPLSLYCIAQVICSLISPTSTLKVYTLCRCIARCSHRWPRMYVYDNPTTTAVAKSHIGEIHCCIIYYYGYNEKSQDVYYIQLNVYYWKIDPILVPSWFFSWQTCVWG